MEQAQRGSDSNSAAKYRDFPRQIGQPSCGRVTLVSGTILRMSADIRIAQESARNEGILSLWIRDRRVLRAASMPFLRHGGLFVPTDRPLVLGDEVFLLLRLLDDPERIPVAGKVVWITPKGTLGRAAGAGVQFSGEDSLVRDKIENCLSGVPDTDYRTHTL